MCKLTGNRVKKKNHGDDHPSQNYEKSRCAQFKKDTIAFNPTIHWTDKSTVATLQDVTEYMIWS